MREKRGAEREKEEEREIRETDAKRNGRGADRDKGENISNERGKRGGEREKEERERVG